MSATEIMISNSGIVKVKYNEGSDLPANSVVLTSDTDLDSEFEKTNAYWAKVKTGSDEKRLYKISASNSSTVGVIKGEHYAAASEDLIILNNEEGDKIFVLESAKYARKDGYIYIYGTTACEVGVIDMP